MSLLEDNSRLFQLFVVLSLFTINLCTAQGYSGNGVCPPQELILPCRCSEKGQEIQIWCSHSDLPRVLNGIKSTSKALNRPIDELILENNFLPSLPGRAFAQLQITRLMLRHNGLERLSAGWLNDMEMNLVEIFIVERSLRSIPVDSLFGIRNLEAITIQSESLKRCPEFSGLPKLRYINIESDSLIELSPHGFRDLMSVESISIINSKSLIRLESGLFVDLPKLKSINFQRNGIEWIHLRALTSTLMSLQVIDLSYNRISNAGMIGRAIKDIQSLETLNLNHNFIEVLTEASFVDLPRLKELRLNDNLIHELHHGAFHRLPSLKIVHLENNRLRHVHPESFLMSSGRGVETIHLQFNDIGRIEEVRSILDALPTLRYLDLSNNKITEIPFGALRGHGNLEQLHLNNNHIRIIERDALMAMPSLRELRLRNNSLTDLLPMPFWNLPALKGLDISFNKFRRLEPIFLIGLPSIRRFDISENALSFIEQSVFRNTPMLETVNISSNELNSIERNTFTHLTNLYELDVSNNNLIEMISGLPRAIERISMRNNKIQNLATSPESDLPNLRMVDLSSNNLAKVHKVFTRSPQLRVLNLARNKLASIEETNFLGLNRLEVLNLQENQISSMHDLSTVAMGNLKELNLQGNRLEIFTDKILDNTPNIEKLDLSRNNIIEIMPGSFKMTKLLLQVDLSGNALKKLPESLDNLQNLKDIDVSFNNIELLTPEILQSWRNLEEFRASNNKIIELSQGTFKNLPMLQYLDISSNDISNIQRGAIRNLPELQEIVLADNRLVELRERIFEDLPNLQAIHLQQNNLKMIAPNTFYNSPSVLYLNLSTNQFRHMENINLRNARNLEVLDLSNNEIRRVSAHPLSGLDWLVELKLNDNRICKIQGEPFASMPRLRVLNLRNNRMGRLQETNFRNLRSNIAILDVVGNPIDCSCDMLWLRAWLQETNSQGGPSCRDGTMLRDLNLNRQNCNIRADDQNVNKIPLTNEHGDMFLRRHNDQDDCGPISGEGGFEDFPPNQQYYNNQRPSVGDSDYFYDQYIDYPINETLNNTLNSGSGRLNITSPFVDFNQNKFNQNPLPPPPPILQTPASQFTFFGHPLPSLTLGNVWGAGRTANNRAASGESTRGKGRVQIFRPGDPELEVIVNQPNDLVQQDNNNGNLDTASIKKPVVDPLEKMDQKFYRPYPQFQTPFSLPKPESGFSPMIPGMISGFFPIHAPTKNETTATVKPEDWSRDDDFKEIRLVTKSESQTKRTSTKPSSSGKIDKIGSSTISHLTTSLSPILSTLLPKVEVITERSNIKNLSENEEDSEDSEENSKETYSRNTNKVNKMSFEEEVFRQNFEMTETTPIFSPTGYFSSTTEEIMQNESAVSLSPPSTTENFEPIDSFVETDGSSELSADHLIAPGSIISQDITNKIPSLPAKAGKITKVFSPSTPVANSNEISKLLSPFYPQQFSSEPPTSFDNEYQPNQIYTQTFNDNERISEAPYDRNDMEWYFNNYNQSAIVNSNPILNYNLQPEDNYEQRSSTTKLNLSSLLFIVVISIFIL